MTENKTNFYTVCYLFDLDLKNVLLVKKNRTDFKGQLNGCGGTIEKGESGYESALREIEEETGLDARGLRSLGTVRLIWLGDLVLPYDCKTHDGRCGLSMYAGIVEPVARGNVNKKTDAGEELVWESTFDILASGVTSHRYAGEGDLQYFINQAVKRLKGLLPERRWNDDDRI